MARVLDAARARLETETSFDTRGLALFRVLSGLGLVLYALSRIRGDALVAFHTDLGVLPSSVMLASGSDVEVWSFFYGVRTPLQMYLATVLMVLVFTCLAVGYHTRVSALASALILVSLHHRNPLVTTAAQVFMNISAVWAVFLPLGEAWSVDAWLRPTDAPRRRRVVSLAALGLRVHIFFVYFLNCVQKEGASWTRGEAFHRMIWNDWTATPVARLLRPHEPGWLSPTLSYAVLVIEGVIALCVITPVHGRAARRVAAALIIGLHVSIHVFNDIGLFPYALTILAVLLLATDDFDRFEAWILPRAGRLAPVLRATGPNDATRLVEAPFVRKARRVGLALRETYCVVLLAAVTWNVWDVNVVPERWLGVTTAPRWAQSVVDFLDLPGGWHLFAPDVPNLDARVVVDAVLSDGRHVDPLTGAPPDFDIVGHRPRRLHYLWQAYQMELCLRNQRVLWVPLVAYLRRVPYLEGWRGARDFRSVDVYVVSVRRPDRGRAATPPRVALAARWPTGEGTAPREERVTSPSRER